MAHILNISVKTVEFHKAGIMDELGLRTTAELTRYAIEVSSPVSGDGELRTLTGLSSTITDWTIYKYAPRDIILIGASAGRRHC